MFYGAFALIATGISALAPTVTTTAVTNWFKKRASIATGIMISGFGLSGLMIPLVVWLIDAFQWRTTMIILGSGMLAIGLPLSLLVRGKPEKYGYLPYGEINSAVIPDAAVSLPSKSSRKIGVKQVLKNSAFWHISLAFTCQIMIVSALITHVMPYFSSLGISRATSSLVATAIPLASIVGRIGFGWLGDRLEKRHITSAGLAAMGIGLLLFSYISSDLIWLAVPFVFIFSIGHGGVNTMRFAMVRELFGRRRYGTVFGMMALVMMVGNISGAPLAGWVFDSWGSYQGIWLAFAFLATLALASIATTPKKASP